MQGKSEHRYELAAVQSKMARAATGLGIRDLAKRAGASPDTIARLERREELKSSTVEVIRTALEAGGVEFIAENGGDVGVDEAGKDVFFAQGLDGL